MTKKIKSKNENYLKGMQCPKCKALEPFYIMAKASFTVYDNGTQDFEMMKWENDSFCECAKCGQEGTVGDFSILECIKSAMRIEIAARQDARNANDKVAEDACNIAIKRYEEAIAKAKGKRTNV